MMLRLCGSGVKAPTPATIPHLEWRPLRLTMRPHLDATVLMVKAMGMR
jgi:hypothetical protein